MSKKPKKRTFKKKLDKSKTSEYEYHLPVLLKESIDFLVTEKSGYYIDGTLGGGGHAAEILARLDSGGNLTAFDKDPDSIAFIKRKYMDDEPHTPRASFTVYNDSFTMACSIQENREQLSGLLLDLGVSSKQLDTAGGGLSYRVNSRLDMRFGPQGQTAEELLNTASEEEIARVLHDYGEEPMAKVIARRIAEKRRASTLRTTFDLRYIVEEIVSPAARFKVLSKVFQALRIAVNNELKELDYTLTNIVPRLAPKGRIVVISYHSLEDRIVKNIFRDISKRTSPEDPAKPVPKLNIITPKPIIPGREEIKLNPRARSAKMRVAERAED
ncbi:MAG: 16S rRNA (cytosine(1402)-N(4))-methyltransferase RsmH [Candidatus Kapaibacterium sp.]